MIDPDEDSTPGACGCCQEAGALAPAAVENRPGLSELAYRVGTHGSFKAAQLAALRRHPALRDLTSREDGDPTVALLDSWATVLDVLSFYQERIANEGYLRTATERLSVLELARAIGYELHPGVAASTWLAFTLETAPGAPAAAVIEAGAKAQSIPDQDELPQVFETVERLEARAAWNSLAVRARQPHWPAAGDTDLYLRGTALGLKPGDPLLVVGPAREADPTDGPWELRRAQKIQEVPAADPRESAKAYTVVELDQALGPLGPAAAEPRVYALRLRASLFGHNAPEWLAMPNSVKAAYLGLDPQSPVPSYYREWPGFTLAGISDPPPYNTPGTGLFGEYFQGKEFEVRKLARTDATIDFTWPGSPAPGVGADQFSVRWTGWVLPKAGGVHTFYVTVDDGIRLRVDGQLLIDQWKDQGATEYSGTIALAAGRKYDIELEYYENAGAAVVKLAWSASGVAKEIIPQSQLFPRDIHDVHLDAVVPQILAGSWLVLNLPGQRELYRVEAATEDGKAAFTLSAKVSCLKLRGKNLREIFNERVRQTSVLAHSERLEMAERPLTTPLTGKLLELAAPAEALLPGRLLAVSGRHAGTGEPVSEVAVVERVDSPTRLALATDLKHPYRRDTATVNANVARATHGESKREVLGSGDGSRPFQRFELKQRPLTYVSAPTPSGTRSTLEVRVDGILWHEVPSLYQAAAHARVYITRLDDDGRVAVQFGDGRHGSRLPTGPENVQAAYRVGTGRAGLLDAGQISLLLTRPLGVQGVTNPEAPAGAAAPETLDGARGNAPLTVLTLERVVSLRDFEDFARAFGGIGKAQATWLWNGERRLVHLTVAADGGGAVPAGSDLAENLRAALDANRTPDQPLRMDSFVPRPFGLAARLKVDPDRRAADVIAAARAALERAFSFAARNFGQAVTASEVFAVLQGVDGVVGVVLDSLGGLPGFPPPRLPAQTARWVGDQIAAAELRTVDLAQVLLTPEAS